LTKIGQEILKIFEEFTCPWSKICPPLNRLEIKPALLDNFKNYTVIHKNLTKHYPLMHSYCPKFESIFIQKKYLAAPLVRVETE
jgi:hypothetical protein